MNVRDTYTSYLSEAGYRPTLDERGNVCFRCEGGHYMILVDDDDPKFFQLLYPNFWPIDGAPESHRALAAAATLTASVKIAKVLVVGNNVHVSAELLLPTAAAIEAVLERSVATIRAAVERFRTLMTADVGTCEPIGRDDAPRDFGEWRPRF